MATLDSKWSGFGHLNCKPLESISVDKFKNDIETGSVYTKLTILKERRFHRPLYYRAMKTMYAAILFKAENSLDSKIESITHLNEVLQEDKTNITALADLVYIYEYSGDIGKADCFRKRLTETKDDHMALARAWYDRAHIIRHFEQDKRQFSYHELLETSKYHIEQVKRSDIKIERGEILFDYSLSLYRKYSLKTEFGLLKENEIKDSNEILEQSIESFLDVINTSFTADSPYDCKALSHIFISILLRLKTSFDEHIGETTSYVNKHLADCNLDRTTCLEAGLSLAPEDANVLRRVASELIHLNRLEEAEKHLEKSILKEESWFAYRHRGKLYLKRYKNTEDDKYLSKAKCSFDEAYRMRKTHADLSDHGYIYLLRGEKQMKHNPDEASKLFDQAKMNFAEAVKLTDCDDNCNPLETYKRWGRCLQLTDEEQGLKLVRSRSVECEVGLQRNPKSYQDDDVAGGVPSTIGDLSLSKNKHDFYVITSPSDREWVGKELVPTLEGEYNLKGFLSWRNKVLGEAFISTNASAMCASRYIIIVLSPNFKSCHWCTYELSLALNKAVSHLADHVVLSIMLQCCEIPDILKPFCEGTRFIRSIDRPTDFWQQLQKVLKT